MLELLRKHAKMTSQRAISLAYSNASSKSPSPEKKMAPAYMWQNVSDTTDEKHTRDDPSTFLRSPQPTCNKHNLFEIL